MGETESHCSQPKLELYRLFQALRHFCIYIIGVQNLYIVIDMKYIKGMLNEPNLQPNVTINCWIQRIFSYSFMYLL